ncbi:MAG: hypothetical protein LUC45_07670, partial [Paraprevotella sp.]|nr:hypothetical protein [Paraprevotella sp.]
MASFKHLLRACFAPRTLVLRPEYEGFQEFMYSLPERFSAGEGKLVYKGRNELRKFEYGGRELVVKSFHRPNLINRFVYGIIRPSKAKRSYVHAEMFVGIGVGTPAPVGYLNVRRGLLFDRSYYVTLASECPYVYNDLFYQHFDYADDVIRAVGRVTAILHGHGYAHKDYGRGNILFRNTPYGVKIEIVDLNRMYIGPIDLKMGCKNFERLPATPHMHRLMAEEYAALPGFDPEECFELMEACRSTQPV